MILQNSKMLAAQIIQNRQFHCMITCFSLLTISLYSQRPFTISFNTAIYYWALCSKPDYSANPRLTLIKLWG